MSEYIIWESDGIEVQGHHVTQREQREEVVRCIDCKHYDESDAGCSYFVLAKNKLLHIGNPDGFCAWGERKWLTCKCGEELESEGKCPSCGRWVHD